ncbi:hypothetical protein ACJX0J_027365, partial [Zea mays]
LISDVYLLALKLQQEVKIAETKLAEAELRITDRATLICDQDKELKIAHTKLKEVKDHYEDEKVQIGGYREENKVKLANYGTKNARIRNIHGSLSMVFLYFFLTFFSTYTLILRPKDHIVFRSWRLYSRVLFGHVKLASTAIFLHAFVLISFISHGTCMHNLNLLSFLSAVRMEKVRDMTELLCNVVPRIPAAATILALNYLVLLEVTFISVSVLASIDVILYDLLEFQVVGFVLSEFREIGIGASISQNRACFDDYI